MSRSLRHPARLPGPLAAATLLVLAASVHPRLALSEEGRSDATLAPVPGAHDDSNVIVLRVAEPMAAVSRRVAAELGALGFAVVLEPASAESLQDVARRRQALAAIDLGGDERGVTITVLDRVTGKQVSRTIAADPQVPQQEVIALGCAELLRASLMEIEAPSPVRGEVKPSAPARALAAVPRHQPEPPKPWSLRVGGQVSTVAGFSLAPEVTLGLSREVGARWEVNLSLAAQVGAARHEDPRGHVDVLTQRGYLGVGWRWLTRPAWRGALDAELGLAHLVASGFASSPPWVGTSSVAWLPMTQLSGRLQRRLVASTWLGLQGAVGFSLRDNELQILGEDLATWGRPQGALGLELGVIW